MRNWFRRRRPVASARKRLSGSYRPVLEGLEDRTLLSVSVNPIGSQSIPSGKTLILPLVGNSTDGSALTYTVTSDDSHITAQVHTGNSFLKISVAGFGDMTFELFNDLTPQTVTTISGFIKSEFYDGLTFHRIVPGFVIQGGDPAGNGTGGPGFTFDDEFNSSAIFSGNGQLALANSGKDTNGSQFFITIGAQRSLDFNHAIFGQLIRGFDVLSAIDAVQTDSNQKPLRPVVITQAELVPDATDAVVSLSSASGFTGTANITVTASDGHSAPGTQTFQLQAVTDATNDPPILGPVSDQVTPAGTPLTFTITATDLENEQLQFEAVERDNGATNATITVTPVNNNSATVTVTPNTGFTGPIHLQVGVKDPNATNRNEANSDPFDTQNITIGVGDQALVGSSAPFNATEGAAVTSVVVARFTDADATATAADFTATVNWGEGDRNVPPAALTTGTVTGSNGMFTVTATKPAAYREAGVFTVKVSVTDKLGATAKVQTQATVADAALTGQAVALSETQGLPFSNVTVATFTDANPNAKVTDFSATISWGDGQTSVGIVGTGPNNTFVVQGSHTYVTHGALTLSVTINDVTPVSDVPGSMLTVSATATVAAPSNASYVTKLYRDFLGHDPDHVGLANWTDFLNRGLLTRFQVAYDFATSHDARVLQITGIYNSVLGRVPDHDGLELAMQFLQKGGSFALLRAVLAGSPEFFQKHGNGNNSVVFVNAIYPIALGRPADAFAQTTIVGALDKGLDREKYAESLFTTLEARTFVVQAFFQEFLRRPGDFATVNNAATALENGMFTEEQIIAFLASSDEYVNF